MIPDPNARNMSSRSRQYAVNGVSTKIILIAWMLMGISHVNLKAQDNSFIYMQEGKFYQGCSEFYPVMLNYSLMFEDSSGYLRLTPAMSNCELIGECNSCGTSKNDYRKVIVSHLRSIVEMGFNSLRVVGLAVRFDGDKNSEGQFTGNLITSSYYKFGQPGTKTPNCHIYSKKGVPLVDTYDFERHADLIEQLFGIIRSEKIPLKVMLLTGEHGIEAVPEMYADYLGYLAERFSDEPILFSYDLYNEPQYQEIIDPLAYTKYDRANWFYSWSKAIKQQAPWHYVTYGPVIFDVLGWDPEVIPADFFACHIYSPPYEHTGWSSEAAFETYKVYLEYAARSFTKPWIIGETGLSATDPALFNNAEIHPVVRTLEEQRIFVGEVLKYVHWYGIGGYAHWVFKDGIWSFKKLNDIVAKQYFMGLVNFRENNDWKPAAYEFSKFRWDLPCVDCTPPFRDTYFNPYFYPFTLLEGHVLSGDWNGNIQGPYNNAIIRGTIGKLGSKDFDHPFLTFSDDNGNFTIRSLYNDPDQVVKQIRMSGPAMDMAYRIHWSKGVDMGTPFQINSLDPHSLPAIPALEEKKVLSGRKPIQWNKKQVLQEQTLVLKKGVHLIVTDTLFVKPGARIEIRKGGTLEINGGAIIGLCEWEGIDVYENSGRRKRAKPAKDAVILSNGGFLKNSRYTIKHVNR